MEEPPGWPPTSNNKYLYNGKEKQTEGYDKDNDGIVDVSLDWYDYGWRMYDPQIARWHGIDQHCENYISMSPYHYGANNPIRVVELDGMDYYYTQDGVYLGQDDKKTQYVYSVNNDSYSGEDGNFVVMESGLTQIMDNEGNGMLHDQFKDLAGTLYAEGSSTWEEAAGIYSVMENRGNADGKTTNEVASGGGIYGYSERDKIDDPRANKDNVQNAYKGLIKGATESTDYSGGGYFWHGKDFGLKDWKANKSFYQAGFDFTNNSHDLWKQGDHASGNKKWDYKYESTGASGKTTFMKLTQEWQKANTSNYWDGSYKK